MRKKPDHSAGTAAGFSIIEAMFAMVIFAIGIVAVSGVFLINIKQNAVAQDVTQVSTLAQDMLEDLTDINYDAMAAGGDAGSITADETGYFDTPEPGYLRRWEIDVDALVAGMTTIRVRVISARQLIGDPAECTVVLTRTR
jgi:type II secretory pathway pseudopilin PulG